MALKEDSIGQQLLLPINLKEKIQEDDLCYFLENVVDSIDFSYIDKEYKVKCGQKAYSRKLLLRIVIMALFYQTYSSRKIAKLVRENIVFMYLAGMQESSYRTIARFKIDNDELIEKTFLASIAVAKKANMVGLTKVSVDETKTKANASPYKNLSMNEIKILKEMIEESIKVDQEENKIYNKTEGQKVPEEYQTRKVIEQNLNNLTPLKTKNRKETKQETKQETKDERIDKLKFNSKMILKQAQDKPENRQEILTKLDKCQEELIKNGKNIVNYMDPEAYWMPNKKGNMSAEYNEQILVDNKHGIILTTLVTQKGSDHNLLIP
ncbi:MAG: transposase [Methanobacteriaceae archaeon]|nr:transposase [Methanobacteriaceae archaeon]